MSAACADVASYRCAATGKRVLKRMVVYLQAVGNLSKGIGKHDNQHDADLHKLGLLVPVLLSDSTANVARTKVHFEPF